MNIRRFILFGTAAVTMICAASCKKDKGESLPYLDGVPQFSLPAYGSAGEVFEFVAGGVSADNGSEVDYYWTASPIQNSRDTSHIHSRRYARLRRSPVCGAACRSTSCPARASSSPPVSVQPGRTTKNTRSKYGLPVSVISTICRLTPFNIPNASFF